MLVTAYIQHHDPLEQIISWQYCLSNASHCIILLHAGTLALLLVRDVELKYIRPYLRMVGGLPSLQSSLERLLQLAAT